MPGTDAGKFTIPAGTTHDTSPLSFEDVACLRPPSGTGSGRRPSCGFSADFWKSSAKGGSSSDHFGTPTTPIFFWIASAIDLLTSCGQADAAYLTSQVVPVISAAPSAIFNNLS